LNEYSEILGVTGIGRKAGHKKHVFLQICDQTEILDISR